MRPDISGDRPLERERRPAGHGAPDLKSNNKRQDNDSVAVLQQAELAAAHFLARRHFIRLPIARVLAAELLAVAEAGR